MLITIDVDEETGRVTVDPSAARKRAAEPWDGEGIAGMLVKSVPEKRITLHCCYPVNKSDVARAADGHVDFAGKQAVEDAAHEFMLKSQRIGLHHEPNTDGAGRVVECGLHRGPDGVLRAADGSEQTITDGDWMLAIQWNPETWALIKSGKIRGVSMQGSAVRRRPDPQALAQLRKEEGDAS